MKRYLGVKHIKDDTYQLNFRPFKKSKRVFRRVKAESHKAAFAKLSEIIAETRKIKNPEIGQRENETFDEIFPTFERNIIADNLTKKTIYGLKRVYKRLFNEFRLKRFPHVTTPAQLGLPFFLEYKSYYGVELKHPTGLESEFGRVVCIMNRLRKLRYCSESIIKDMREIKIPQSPKKDYPEITDSVIKVFLTVVKRLRPDLYGPIYFMLRTGRRVEETTLIERKDVIWEGVRPVKVKVRAETTKMRRVAPLNYLDPDLEAHIRQAYQKSNNRHSPYLFLNRLNKKCSQRVITRFLGDLSEEVLKVRITSHYFRHRFCTECGKANLPLIDVMAISGIKDVGILTRYYSHSTNEGLSKVLESTRLM